MMCRERRAAGLILSFKLKANLPISILLAVETLKLFNDGYTAMCLISREL